MCKRDRTEGGLDIFIASERLEVLITGKELTLPPNRPA
jgi:hypothetical protein